MADIVICAGQSVTRAGLAAMATMATTQIVGQVSSVQALETWLQTQQADLAVIELSALGIAESKAVLQLIEELPLEEVLAVLLLVEAGIESAARKRTGRLMGTGSVSILPMTVSANQLRCAIAAILCGFTLLHPDSSEVLFLSGDMPFGSTESSLPVDPLTPREIQVLNQLANGLANKAIATALDISEHTVKFHISAILSKLNVSSRTEAVSVGIRTGLVML
ncbi:MAG: response regulator transcription factor [Phormidesmis sp.]